MAGLCAWVGRSSAAGLAPFRTALAAMADRGQAEKVELEFDGGWLGAAVDEPGDVGRFGAMFVAIDGHPANLRALTAEQVARESGAGTPAEVVGAVFAEVGVQQGLSRMEGSFAAVVWDAEARCLWAVRDRVGARPMAWTRHADGVMACSTPGAWPREGLDTAAFDRLTRLGCLPPPLSVRHGVQRLAAGSLLRWDGDAATVLRWWDVDPSPAGRGGALVRWVQSLEFAARLCVRTAVGGTPAGLCAVWVEDDASRAVLAASRHPVDGKLPAIVVDIDGEPVVDGALPDARTVERVRLGPDDVDRALADLADQDEPVAGSDALLWWAVARRAERLGVRQVLTGRGAEGWLDEGLRQSRVGRWLAPRAIGPTPERSPELDRILAESPAPAGGPWLARRVGLPEGALRTADLVGTGLGVRFAAPLCDPRLVQLGASVPVGHHREVPALLWRAMGAPPAGSPRAGVPIRRWLAGPCASLVVDLPDRLGSRVDPTGVRALIAASSASDAAAERVYRLLVIERWLRGR